MPTYKEGFGTRSIAEPTELCDILNTIQQVPKALRPEIVNDLEEYIKKVVPKIEACHRIRESFITFTDREEFIKEPSFQWWFSAIKLNLWDAIVDIKKTGKQLCEDGKVEQITTTLDKFVDEIKAMKFSTEEIKKKESMMKAEWKREWVEQNAWDFNEVELKLLKTPYDD